MPGLERRFLPLPEAQSFILDGDLLLEGLSNDPIDAAIQHLGNSDWYHAEMAEWCGQAEYRDLMLLEMTIGGGQAVLMEHQVKHLDGAVMDVFHRTDLTVPQRSAIVHYMRHLTGVPYGYRTLFWLALMHRWPGSVLIPRWKDDLPPVCSSAYAICNEKATGMDMWPDKDNWEVTPGVLYQTFEAYYVCSLRATE